MERRFFAVVIGMGGVIPGVLALVALRCVHGFAAMIHGLVGLVVVVTGDAGVATLDSVATLYSLGSPHSVDTLCGGCRSILVVASYLMMAFRRRCLRFFGTAMMDSLSSSCTAAACCVGLSVGRRQCCGKRSKDSDILRPPVSGTKNFMLR